MNLVSLLKSDHKYAYLIIVVLGIVLFFPFLGEVHLFDWDEINFAEAAREMLVSSNYLQVQIDFQEFYEKPPLFLWLQVIGYKIFGVGELGARFPNGVFGILSLLFIYGVANKFFGRRLAFYWVLMFLCSLLPHFYFRSGIIDPVFNFFIYSSIVSFFIAWTANARSLLYLSGILIGLAILTKGPVGILISGACLLIYGLISKNINLRFILHLITYTLVGLAIASLWFIADFLTNGADFLGQFIKYQVRLFSTEDAGHGGFPGYHVIVLLFGCFPASIYALGRFKKSYLEDQFLQGFIILNKTLFFVVLILFSVVQSKIVHYSSLCYFPLCFLAASNIEEIIKKKKQLSLTISIFFYSILAVFAIIFLLLPNLNLFPELLDNLTEKDLFAQSISSKEGPWKAIDILPFGLLILAALVFQTSRESKNKINLSSYFLLAFVIASIYIFPSRIEYYTQKDLISFVEKASEDGKTIYPVNHKSYIHLFYGKKPSSAYVKPKSLSILDTKIHEDIYLFTRIDRPIDLNKHSDIIELERIPGYIIYLKSAPK